MGRTLSVDAATKLATALGGEPVMILGIRWNNQTEIKYATKDLPGILGRIQSITPLSETIQLEGNGTSASFSVVLDDTDGDLKGILDTVDIHKNQCVLYQWFDGLAISDAFVLFNGEISSPIVWSEAEQTLSFVVLNKIESREVGFAPEEGQFATVSPTLVGNVWPLAFGEVLHVPAQKAVEKIRGATQTMIGIPDYTLPYKYWHLRERMDILAAGFNYYKSAIHALLGTLPQISAEQEVIWSLLQQTNISNEVAIESFFNYITATAQALENDYVSLILQEDDQRQEFENINVYITKVNKRFDDVSAFASTAEEIEDSVVTEFQDEINDYVDEYKALVNASTALTEEAAESTISLLEASLSTLKTKAVALVAAGKAVDALEVLVQQYETITASGKTVSEKTDKELEIVKGFKDVFEVDLDNAEYAFQHIKSILNKLNKVYINEFKTRRELYKVQAAIQQHNLIPRGQVTVIDGDKFPQDTPTRITINGMTYSGSFHGKLFTASSIQPQYSAIGVQFSDRLVDSFTITHPTADLTGHYCLVTVPTQPTDIDYDPANPYRYKIFQVTNQIGRRCTMRLLELNPTRSIASKQNRLPLIKELPSYLQDALSDASEHTFEEKKRILEDGIPKYDADELDRIKDTLEKLKDISLEAPDDDTINVINETIYKKIEEYNTKVSKLTYKKEAIDKVNEKISEEEHKNFLRLQNLKYRLSDQDDEDYEILATNKFYYITGYEVTSIIATSPVMLPGWFSFSPQGQELEQNNTVISLPDGSRIKANFLPDSGLWYAEVGSVVESADQISEKYICNILPSEIKSVYAYKNVNGVKQLLPVPTIYYTKNEADDYGSLTCTTITLAKRLSDYPGEGWEDGIYVSMSSSVGPNTVDIIEWILSNYTDLTIDSTSFNEVRTLLTNYPSSFALFDKRDALALVRDIAWQARCALWVVDQTVFIRYLSETPTPLVTVTESDIIAESLTLEFSETESIVTKLTAAWKPNYAVDKDNQVVLRHNVPKYGTMEQEYSFFIYNIEDLVQKSATFWLIRKANTWKRIKFQTALNKLAVEVFDAITIDVTPNHFGLGPITAIVEEAEYDSADNVINFVCWCPIRSGEMVPYDFAWPSSVSVDTVYPTTAEIASGYAGSGFSTVPTNLAYNITPNSGLIDQLVLRPKDYGRPFMSDQYDTLPNSVLEDLREEDYITAKPEKYVLPEQPRVGTLNTKPEYTGAVTPKQNESPIWCFVGRIESAIDSTEGTYKVKTNNNREYAVRQVNGGSLPLPRNQPVTVIYDEASGQWVMNESAASFGDGSLYLAEVKLTSGSGLTSSYICDIFNGDTPAAFEEDLLVAGATVFQDTNSAYFFHREIVAVHQVGGRWLIQKLTQTTLINNFEDGDLVIRPAGATSAGTYSYYFPAITGTQYSLVDYVVPFTRVITLLRDALTEFYEAVYDNAGYMVYLLANDSSLIPFKADSYRELTLMKDVVGSSSGSITPDLASYGKTVSLVIDYDQVFDDDVSGSVGNGYGEIHDSQTYTLVIGAGSTISQTVSISRTIPWTKTTYFFNVETVRQNALFDGTPTGSVYVHVAGGAYAACTKAFRDSHPAGTNLTSPAFTTGSFPDPSYYYQWDRVASTTSSTSAQSVSYSGSLVIGVAAASGTSAEVTAGKAAVVDPAIEKPANRVALLYARWVATGLDRSIPMPSSLSYDDTESYESGSGTSNHLQIFYTLSIG